MQFFLNGSEATLTDFAKDELARAVVNSLFSWARAEDDDERPTESKMGWWADSFAEPGDKFGSRLWLWPKNMLKKLSSGSWKTISLPK